MPPRSIPQQIKQQAMEIIERFNNRNRSRYEPCWRGAFLYLGRVDHGVLSQICRLRYTGDMHKWEFAIFKYSSERYDPEERWFPGYDCLDGTIEGALKAGMQAYP